VRVVQAAGIIFKGSGFYVNDSKSASSTVKPAATKSSDSGETKSSETKTNETKTESKPEPKAAAAD
jgi:predicted nucleic acid-binding Zn ribbon protein